MSRNTGASDPADKWFNCTTERRSKLQPLVAAGGNDKTISWNLANDEPLRSATPSRKSPLPRSILKNGRNTPDGVQRTYETQAQFKKASKYFAGNTEIGPVGRTLNEPNDDYSSHNNVGHPGRSWGKSSVPGQGNTHTSFRPPQNTAGPSSQGSTHLLPLALRPANGSHPGNTRSWSVSPHPISDSGQGSTQSWAVAPLTANHSDRKNWQERNDLALQRALAPFEGSWKLFIDVPPAKYTEALLNQAVAHNINLERFADNGELDEKRLADFIYASELTCEVFLSGFSDQATSIDLVETIREGALQSMNLQPSMGWNTFGKAQAEVAFKTRAAAERFVERGRRRQIFVRGQPVQCKWSMNTVSATKAWEKDQTRILQIRGPAVHVSDNTSLSIPPIPPRHPTKPPIISQNREIIHSL